MKTATYSTTGFVTGSSILWILVISQAALFIMVPVFALGLHPFISVAMFIAVIYGGFQLVTGKVVYTVTAEGLTKDVTPNLLKNFWNKQRFQFYSWDQINSFRSGTDTDRSLEQFDYLTIRTRKGKLEINTKKGDRNNFREFETVFRQYAGAVNAGVLRTETTSSEIPAGQAPTTATAETGAGRHTIREKPDFYKTPFAKVLTVCFILMFIGIFALMIVLENTRLANIFRLTFIILPGVLYMTWRAFLKKADGNHREVRS